MTLYTYESDVSRYTYQDLPDSSDYIELDQMECLEFENGSITALPFLGEHSDLNIRRKAAHLVRIGKRSLLLAADSCNLETRLYEHPPAPSDPDRPAALGSGLSTPACPEPTSSFGAGGSTKHRGGGQ
jgi:hypothetical protein